MPDSIIIATYQHKHGSDVRAFANEEGAEAWRQEIAASFWDQATDKPKPSDPVEMADFYFTLGESYGDEWFSTEAAIVEGAKSDPARDAATAMLEALRTIQEHAGTMAESADMYRGWFAKVAHIAGEAIASAEAR